MKYPTAKNFIAGAFVDFGGDHLDVLSPLDGAKFSSVPLSSSETVDAAVQSAGRAFSDWAERTIKQRA